MLWVWKIVNVVEKNFLILLIHIHFSFEREKSFSNKIVQNHTGRKNILYFCKVNKIPCIYNKKTFTMEIELFLLNCFITHYGKKKNTLGIFFDKNLYNWMKEWNEMKY